MILAIIFVMNELQLISSSKYTDSMPVSLKNMLFPDNFTIFERVHVTRLFFLIIFGMSTSISLAIAEDDPEVIRRELYKEVIANSK